jgi:hypothetical protein
MNKRPGHVVVTTEVGFCSFCGRPRNLRHEAHQLGTLVRTIVTCETCHRTLSSTIGVATAEPVAPEPITPEPEPTPQVVATPATPRKPRAATKTTTKGATRKKAG